MNNHNLILDDKHEKPISIISPIRESFTVTKYGGIPYNTFRDAKTRTFFKTDCE